MSAQINYCFSFKTFLQMHLMMSWMMPI